jgi:hypothetical protein
MPSPLITHSVDGLNIDIFVFLSIANRRSIPIRSPNINNGFSRIRGSLESEDLRLTLRK